MLIYNVYRTYRIDDFVFRQKIVKANYKYYNTNVNPLKSLVSHHNILTYYYYLFLFNTSTFFYQYSHSS